MRKFLILIICVPLMAFVPIADAAPRAKAGAKCSKAGQTQTNNGKKFTCVKSGSKLTWNKGVTVATKPAVTALATGEPSTPPAEISPTPTASPTVVIVKYKNCTEVKAAGAAPLSKVMNPELYELNAGLDRDKDGIACEN